MAAVAGSARRGEIRQFWRTFSRNQLAMCGGAVVAVLVFLAVRIGLSLLSWIERLDGGAGIGPRGELDGRALRRVDANR